MKHFKTHAQGLAREIALVTPAAANEATLRHEAEKLLETHCQELGVPWLPLTLDRAVSAGGRAQRFIDVAHGAVIIEYEFPGSFRGKEGAQVNHARAQAQEYASLLNLEEGRPIEDYVMVVWDGSHISFGQFQEGRPEWQPLNPFGPKPAEQLLLYLRNDGIPLVHPRLLAQIVGPESESGSVLIPSFFRAIRAASHNNRETNKTLLLFSEWRRIFGQVIGVQSEHLKNLLIAQGRAHGQNYESDTSAYLFALNTYIALVAKMVAALALPSAAQNLADTRVPIETRIDDLESGTLFLSGGVSNMLAGDFFSWYRDDPHWMFFSNPIAELLNELSNVSFDVARKNSDSTRDLFKGLYQSFVPRALRHAMGEYYTPDWLATHALDLLDWKPKDSLLDPTCGSGTFILEAIRRRLEYLGRNKPTAETILQGLYGIDLNPLAVLAARASIVVSIAQILDPENPVTIPVYLADAINPATVEKSIFRHRLQTELGIIEFGIPKSLIDSRNSFTLFSRMRELINSNSSREQIIEALAQEFPELRELASDERLEFEKSTAALLEMHARGWDGIWCSILAERFAAGNVPQVSHIAGNPPWVKWSHLPPEYANFIKPRCLELGVFSEDKWVGGIESDISTVITYEVIDKWLARSGKLAFFITGTVFSNESSQGFRKFQLAANALPLSVIGVEDFNEIAPFEGVSNHATLLLLKKGHATTYPIPYRVWQPKNPKSPRPNIQSVREFKLATSFTDLLARPVPGTNAGPWIKGIAADQEVWSKIFGPSARHYAARKGITPDRNGIFFVEVLSVSADGETCKIQNDPDLGRTSGIPQVRDSVESRHVFPLLRGRNVQAFSAVPELKYRVLLPQRGMHGDPDLPVHSPRTFRYLRRFKSQLEVRASYRRFQRNQVFWSVWSTGPYTFSKYKVAWREMAGGRFAAAFIGTHNDPLLGPSIVIPDHKLYFVAVNTKQEAAYLTGLLNAPTVSRAVSAYAAQLSLGVSVVEYLKIPSFDRHQQAHRSLADISLKITARGGGATREELESLDRLAVSILREAS